MRGARDQASSGVLRLSAHAHGILKYAMYFLSFCTYIFCNALCSSLMFAASDTLAMSPFASRSRAIVSNSSCRLSTCDRSEYCATASMSSLLCITRVVFAGRLVRRLLCVDVSSGTIKDIAGARSSLSDLAGEDSDGVARWGVGGSNVASSANARRIRLFSSWSRLSLELIGTIGR